MQPRLVLLDPPAAQREFKLDLPTTIGRSREAKLKLVHGQVSRVHCEFFERDGLLYVRDLGSTNGTFVGDARISEAPVWPGDTVTIGAVKFQAIYEPAEERLPPPGAFKATDTIRKAAEATFHAAKKQSPHGASDTTSPTIAAAAMAAQNVAPSSPQPVLAPPPATASAAPPEPEQKEGSFEWFDDLTADQAEAPAPQQRTPGSPSPLDDAQDTLLPLEETELPPRAPPMVAPAKSPPPLVPGTPAASASAAPQPVEWDELELEPLEENVAAADDSLNILPPPIDPAAGQSPSPPELEWRVPEPTSPGQADFAFHVEEPPRESAPLPKTEPANQPATTDDEDLEKFFKSLDLGGEG